MILITLPVYNEEKIITASTEKILKFLKDEYDFKILIVDNGSTDGTLEKAKELSRAYSNVGFIHLDEKGRGRALRRAWSEGDADIFVYMDIDLSTDLNAFPALIEAIGDGYGIAIGSRYVRGAVVHRSLMRDTLSKGYNLLLKLFFGVGFSDAQCGFKAVNRRVVEEVIPEVRDQEWFFDTELLIRAWKKGFRIKEIPVHWDEDSDSKVKIMETVFDYISAILRLRSTL